MKVDIKKNVYKYQCELTLKKWIHGVYIHSPVFIRLQVSTLTYHSMNIEDRSVKDLLLYYTHELIRGNKYYLQDFLYLQKIEKVYLAGDDLRVIIDTDYIKNKHIYLYEGYEKAILANIDSFNKLISMEVKKKKVFFGKKRHYEKVKLFRRKLNIYKHLLKKLENEGFDNIEKYNSAWELILGTHYK
jgi:hypothetical protein